MSYLSLRTIAHMANAANRVPTAKGMAATTASSIGSAAVVSASVSDEWTVYLTLPLGLEAHGVGAADGGQSTPMPGGVMSTTRMGMASWCTLFMWSVTM